jgi:hypothetical protein
MLAEPVEHGFRIPNLSAEGRVRQMAETHFSLAGDTLPHTICYASAR